MKFISFTIGACLTMCAAIGADATRGGLVISEDFVFTTSPTVMIHSPTIAQTQSGHVVAAWYGGDFEGSPTVSIWSAYHDGSTWSKPMEVDNGIVNGKDSPTWNPVLFQPKKAGAPLVLYYKCDGEINDWQGTARTSTDGGKSWSERIFLPKTESAYFKTNRGRFVGPTKNRPLELPDGTVLLGSSTEVGEGHGGWFAHIERTRDYTGSLELMGPLKGGNAIQPAFLVHSPDHRKIQVICRGTKNNTQMVAFSEDGGKTWGDLRAVTTTCSAGIDAVSLGNGWHVLVGSGGGGGRRSTLPLEMSRDGVNWRVVTLIENDTKWSYEYPSLMLDSKGQLQLVYNWHGNRDGKNPGQSRSKRVILDVKKLTEMAEKSL